MSDQEDKLSRQLLARAIQKQVSEKLGTFSRDLNEFTKGMNEQDAKTAKLMILGMIMASCEDFYEKMKVRVEKGKDTSE